MATLKLVKGYSVPVKNSFLTEFCYFILGLIVLAVNGFWQFFIAIPKQGGVNSVLLGFLRLMLYTWLLYALVYGGNLNSYPYVSWKDTWENFSNSHGLLAFIANSTLLILIFVNLLITTGFAVHPSASNVVSSNKYSDIDRTIRYLDANLRQKSNNGALNYMSKMFGGNLKQ